MYKHAMIHR